MPLPSKTLPPRILCFGEALWDILPSGAKPGGAPMNVALRLQQLGADISLISRVGQDEPGQKLLNYMETQGLKTENIQQDSDSPTGVVNLDLSDPTNARYDIAQPAAWDFILKKQLSYSHLKKYSALVFGSLITRHITSRETLLSLLNKPFLKIFDVNLRPPFVDKVITQRLLMQANWVKLNENELQIIANWGEISGSAEEQLYSLSQDYGLQGICLTRGEHGAALLFEGLWYSHPGYRVKVIDTIGSGDAFLATWVFYMLSGFSPDQALARGCAMGALVAASKGATPTISADELDRMITQG